MLFFRGLLCHSLPKMNAKPTKNSNCLLLNLTLFSVNGMCICGLNSTPTFFQFIQDNDLCDFFFSSLHHPHPSPPSFW